jgi:hypothetical protein
MSPSKLRALRAAITTVLAMTLILVASAAAGQSCPASFFTALESKTDTTAAKQDVRNVCRDRDIAVRGAVRDGGKRDVEPGGLGWPQSAQ